jgi:hypothetical protein
VLSTEVLQQLGLGGAAPPLVLVPREQLGIGHVKGAGGFGDGAPVASRGRECRVDRGPSLERAGPGRQDGGRRCVGGCGHS